MTSYYTTRHRNDGFGGQFQNIIFDILYTYTNTNNKYVFPSIQYFEHNYHNDPEHTNRLIRYMNLKDHFTINRESENSDVVSSYTSDTYSYVEDNISNLIISEPMKHIKSLFYADKSTSLNTNHYNVAVHVRRPNSQDCRLEGSDIADEYYLNVINYIRNNHHITNKKSIQFHIYSQGELAAYDKYINEDTVIHLNDDVLDTFNSLVFADALVTSGSSFSYTAALLSNGVIYYKGFWHKPADFWLIGDKLVVDPTSH